MCFVFVFAFARSVYLQVALEQAAGVAGYGRCWWAASLAAERPSPEAQQHRADSTRSLHLRSILPTLLEAALSLKHGSAAATLEGAHDTQDHAFGLLEPSCPPLHAYTDHT